MNTTAALLLIRDIVEQSEVLLEQEADLVTRQQFANDWEISFIAKMLRIIRKYPDTTLTDKQGSKLIQIHADCLVKRWCSVWGAKTQAPPEERLANG